MQVPGQATRDFTSDSSLECVPAPTFGEIGEVQCVDLRGDVRVATDGLIPSGSTVFENPDLFGDKLQACMRPCACVSLPPPPLTRTTPMPGVHACMHHMRDTQQQQQLRGHSSGWPRASNADASNPL